MINALCFRCLHLQCHTENTVPPLVNFTDGDTGGTLMGQIAGLASNVVRTVVFYLQQDLAAVSKP